MKKLMLLLLVLPIFAVAQKQDVYLKLTDAKGTIIKGDVMVRGFEKNLNVITFATGGKNNSQVNFTMPIAGASADLKKAMSDGQFLLNGLVTITQIGSNGMPTTVYTVVMEKIRVQSCNEIMGCDNVMTTAVTLQPSRIGWTYYQTGRSGIQTVSKKYGIDAETGGAWTNF